MADSHGRKTRAKKGADSAAADLAAVMDEAAEGAVTLSETDPSRGKPRAIRGEDIAPGGWRASGLADLYGMPPDCPVTPLGQDGLTFYFLNPLSQIVSLTVLKADHIQRLFAGRLGYLEWAWPRWKRVVKDINEDGEEVIEFKVDDWNAKDCQRDLYDACARKGVWREFELVRGRGAWREDDGSLTLHCGDVLVRAGSRGKLEKGAPGDYGHVVYPGGPRRPQPWAAPAGPEPAQALLALFGKWAMRRAIDRELLLGYVMSAMSAGALPWRPAVYISGPHSTGKSTLTKKLLRELFSDGAIYTTDPTAAGLYQKIGQDALPVIIDEFEAKSDAARQRAVIELARQASSEGVLLRGGQDHKGVQFQARNCFLFSSILRPAMRSQDMSRMVFVQLDRLPAGAKAPDLLRDELRELGRKLLRRVVDRWDDFYPAFARWHDALTAVGHDSRGADQFGVLMAWAHLALSDEDLDADTLEIKAAELAPYGMVEFTGREEEWDRCLTTLLSAPVLAWRGGAQPTVGRLLTMFIDKDSDLDGMFWADLDMAPRARMAKANKMLASVGLKIEPRQARFRTEVEWWLSVPSNDEKVRNLFEDTDYFGERGIDGVWAAALQSGPRGEIWESRRSSIDGRQRWCTWLDISRIVQLGEPEDEAPPGGAPPPPDGDVPF